MENNINYVEFNKVEKEDNSINFISERRRFFERHFGVALFKTGYFFKRLGKTMKEKFTVQEPGENINNEPKITTNVENTKNTENTVFVYSNKNKDMFDKNVKIAHEIDKIIKDNKDIDLSSEMEELKKLVLELKDIDKENDYKGLEDINKKFISLKFKIINKIKTIKTEVKKETKVDEVKSIENDKKTEVKVEEVKEETKVKLKPIETKKEVMPIIAEEKTPIVKPVEVNALIVKEPVVKKSNNISEIKSKLSLFDRKISAIETKVALYKESLSEVVRNITKIDKILNEDNLDSREYKMYKELRDQKINELNIAKTKVDEAKKELIAAKAEKSLYKQSIIEIDVPQKNGEVYKKEITVNELLEQNEREDILAKAKKEQIKREKLEKEIAALKAKLLEKEALLNDIDNNNDIIGYNSNINNNYTPEEYHEILVNMHKKTFY